MEHFKVLSQIYQRLPIPLLLLDSIFIDVWGSAWFDVCLRGHKLSKVTQLPTFDTVNRLNLAGDSWDMLFHY